MPAQTLAANGGLTLPGSATWSQAAQTLAATGGIVTPLTILGSSLKGWWRPDLGKTLVQGPVIAAGTSPPAVTMTGTPASATQTIVITITTPGVVGVAQFSWSLNSATQQTGQTVASTFLLGSTGITANFPAGTYNTVSTPDTYTSVVTVSALADQSGNGNTFSQATAANQFPYGATSGPNGTSALIGSRAGQTFMTNALAIASAPVWVWIVCQWTSATFSASYIYDAVAVNKLALLRTTNTTSLELIDGGGSLTWSAATPQTAQAYGTAFNGASSSLASNGTVQQTGNLGGFTAITGMTLGCPGGLPADAADCLISEIVVANAIPSATALSTYSQARYGFG